MKLRKEANLIRLGFFFAIVFGLTCWAIIPQKDLRAYGCDSFGYLRQAQLFRDNGLINGLDTRIKEAEPRELIATAKRIFNSDVNWSDILAPHCHHHNDATDEVILQYPPNSGFLLSFMPEKVAAAQLYIILMLCVGAGFAAAGALFDRANWLTSAVGTAVLGLIFKFIDHHGMVSSVSLPATIALIPLTALLAVEVEFKRGMHRLIIYFILGALIGALTGIRIPNIFISLAIIACGLAMQVTLKEKLSAGFAGGAGFALGMVPVFSANLINAGSPFSTTYNNGDASPPTLDPAILFHNFHYYFVEARTAPLLIIASIAVIARLIFPGKSVDGKRRYYLAVAAGAQLLCAIAFFVTHWIRIDYYTLPASSFALCLVAFDLMSSSASGTNSFIGAQLWTRRIYLAAFVSLAVLGVGRLALVSPKTYEISAPPAMLASNVRVWSDMNSGTMYYYLHKYSGKLVFGDDCMRDAMVHEVAMAGYDQYIINDSEEIGRAIGRFADMVPIKPAGTFHFDDMNFPVYLIRAGEIWNHKAPKGCLKSGA